MADEQLVLELLAKDAMSAKVDDARSAIEGMSQEEIDAIKATDGYAEALEKAGGEAQKTGLSLSDLKSGIDLAGQALGKMKQVWDFAKEGAAIQRIGNQWKATAASFGADADAIIEDLDRIAHGTVDDEELMQTASRAFTQGTVQNARQLEQLFKIARASAVRFGGDTAEAFGAIAQATEFGQARALKARVGVVDFEGAQKRLADQLGETTKELTEQEIKTANLNAVLAAGTKLVDEVGEGYTDSADKMAAFENKVNNVFDSLKELAVNGVTPALDGFQFLQLQLDANASQTDKLRAALELSKGVFGENSQQAQVLKERLQQLLDEGKRFQDFAGTIAGPVTGALEGMAAEVNRLKTAQGANLRLTNDSRSAAIAYTKDEERLAELQQKLADIDEAAAKNGPRRTAVIQNQKMSEQERAEAVLKLAVAQEYLAEVQRKEGESDAEFALRMGNARQKVDELSASMGTHTAVVGGMTKAQKEQRAATEEQIAALQKQSETQRATEAFNALTTAYQKGDLTGQQYQERAEALNKIAGLYTKSALDQAIAQEKLVNQLTNPDAENWNRFLEHSRGALDGVAGSTAKVSEKAKALESDRFRMKNDVDGMIDDSRRTAEGAQKILGDLQKTIGELTSGEKRIPLLIDARFSNPIIQMLLGGAVPAPQRSATDTARGIGGKF